MSRKLIVTLIVVALAGISYGATVIGNWESMPTSGDGWIDWDGGQVAIETLPAQYAAGTIGVTRGSQSLEMIKDGYALTLAYSISGNGQTSDFLANTTLEFDVAVPNLNDDGGWYNNGIILNAEGWGWAQIMADDQIGFWAGSGTLSRHYVVDYSAALAAMGPTPGYVEIIFLTNNDSIHNTAYYDNVVLTPEPMTIALLGLGGLFLRRRK